MDHSLYGYLRRRSDEELAAILQYCLREENSKEYYYAIPEIIKIMEERKKDTVQTKEKQDDALNKLFPFMNT